jgi:hypothetical protein
VLRSGPWQGGERRVVAIALRPGRYQVTAECAGDESDPALSGRAEFEVADAAVAVDVVLAPR